MPVLTPEESVIEPASVASQNQLRLPAALIAAAAVAGTAGLTAASGAVAAFAVAVLATMVVAHASRLGWRLATAISILLALVGQVLVSWAAPHVGWTFATDTLVVWTLVGLGHAVLVAIPGPAPTGWSRTRTRHLASALVVPLGLGIYFWLLARRDGPFIAWAMVNDAANYTIIARGFLEDGGLLRTQGNAAPLATVLQVTLAAPEADGLAAPDLVRHLITAGAQLGIAGWLLLGFLTAVLALGSARGGAGTQVLVAVVAGLLPWSWFASGVAFSLGFSNAFPIMLVVLLAWFCWMAQAHRPVGAVTGLVLATWAAATAWGPAAIVPAAWLVTAMVVQRRALLGAGRRLGWPLAALAGAAAYAGLVTASDLSTTGAALAAEGGAPHIGRWWAIGVFAFVMLVALLPRTGMSWTVRLGVWAGVPAAALGAAYLIRARAGLTEWWGYYPVKFTWILLCSLAMIALASLQHPARRLARRMWQGNGVLLAGAVVLLVMSQVSEPVRPVTLASLATPVRLHNSGEKDPALPALFDLMGRNPKSIVAKFSPVPGHDVFINFWLLQMGADGIDDPIRFDAYYLDTAVPATICTAISHWRGGVTVWTHRRKLERELDATCDPAFDYTVELLVRVPVA